MLGLCIHAATKRAKPSFFPCTCAFLVLSGLASSSRFDRISYGDNSLRNVSLANVIHQQVIHSLFLADLLKLSK